jgi:uncharacterized protein
MPKAEEWIGSLGLEPHPEGGWYRETYRSEGSWDFSGAPPFNGRRAYATSIHYLLGHGERSRLHRIHSDELWFFHAGSPLEVHQFSEREGYGCFTLGGNPAGGEVLHSWVPAGSWFGARLAGPSSGGSFALVSCVVAPGFDFRDFSFAGRDELLARFPSQERIIRELT